MDEHYFIISWLREHDPQHALWYISSRQQSPDYWVNEGDDSQLINLDPAFIKDQSGWEGGIPGKDYLSYR